MPRMLWQIAVFFLYPYLYFNQFPICLSISTLTNSVITFVITINNILSMGAYIFSFLFFILHTHIRVFLWCDWTKPDNFGCWLLLALCLSFLWEMPGTPDRNQTSVSHMQIKHLNLCTNSSGYFQCFEVSIHFQKRVIISYSYQQCTQFSISPHSCSN